MVKTMASLADLEELEKKGIKVESADGEELTIAEAREKAIASLDDDPRWKVLVDYWQEEIDTIDKQIQDIDSDISDRELDKLRIRRFYLAQNIELPKLNRSLFVNRQDEEESEGTTFDEI